MENAIIVESKEQFFNGKIIAVYRKKYDKVELEKKNGKFQLYRVANSKKG